MNDQYSKILLIISIIKKHLRSLNVINTVFTLAAKVSIAIRKNLSISIKKKGNEREREKENQGVVPL